MTKKRPVARATATDTDGPSDADRIRAGTHPRAPPARRASPPINGSAPIASSASSRTAPSPSSTTTSGLRAAEDNEVDRASYLPATDGAAALTAAAWGEATT